MNWILDRACADNGNMHRTSYHVYCWILPITFWYNCIESFSTNTWNGPCNSNQRLIGVIQHCTWYEAGSTHIHVHYSSFHLLTWVILNISHPLFITDILIFIGIEMSWSMRPHLYLLLVWVANELHLGQSMYGPWKSAQNLISCVMINYTNHMLA